MYIDGIEYLTKDEVTARLKTFSASTPGSKLHNYAHCKSVRRPKTPAERSIPGYTTEVTLKEWNKLYTNDPILAEHPELKGYWKESWIEE